jgi:hypothetical protein
MQTFTCHRVTCSGCPIFATAIGLSLSEPGYPDRAGFVQKIVTAARPGPVLGSFDKPSRDRVAVHVLQLFDTLVAGEDIEVVVADLPEGSRSEAFGDGEFEGVQGL